MMKWVAVGSSVSKRWQIPFMPWTMFRLRLCDASCKLSFGVWRLLMIALALGKEFAIRDKPRSPPVAGKP